MLFKNPPQDFNPKFEVVLCICIYNDEIVLLQRQSHKPQPLQWGVPAGKVDKNESIENAVQREVHEETGLTIPKENFIFKYSIATRYPEVDFISHIFTTSFSQKEPIQIRPTEHITYTWQPVQTANNLNLMEDLEEILQAVSK